MKDVLAICTRNRPKDLEECLISISKLDQLPKFVFVVDSSTDERSRELTEEYKSKLLNSEVRYLRSDEKGLVMARNVALSNLPADCEVIHFVDDDTELQRGYITEINRVLGNSGKDIVGAGGLILGETKTKTSTILKFLQVDSDKLGSVLPSGVNIGAYGSESPINMEWLPGCSMSFKAPGISGLEFDRDRNIWPLGEDVDFGLKARRRGRLIHVPEARIKHNMSPQNRDDARTIHFQDVIHRWSLAKDQLGGVKKRWVVVSSLSRMLICFAIALRRLDSHYFLLGKAIIQGLWVSIARGGLKASRKSQKSTRAENE